MPIACSLVVDEAQTRVEEWRTFLHHHVVDVIRCDGCARLRLEAGDDALLLAADLARREKACCPFFDFHLVVLADAVWLVIEAPDEAAGVLDGLVELRH